MKQYVVDAFTDQVFSGNPAAICILDHWLPDDILMKIALENNLSETAYAVKTGDSWHLRWFALNGEIDLCGHATMAAAYTIMELIEQGITQVRFDTKSGRITVDKLNGLYAIDFPAYQLQQIEVTDKMEEAIGSRPIEAYIGRDLLCVMDSEESVRNATPDLEKVRALDGLLLHITAKGKDYDCVSRSFAPKCNTPEDPVCGSGHCHIIPYWADKLEQQKVVAYQASRRGGVLYAQMTENHRVELAGNAALFSIDEIFLPNLEELK